MNKYYISKNYRAQSSAGGKAKIDCERILESVGFKSIGLKRTIHSGSVSSFFRTLFGTLLGLLRLKKNSCICIQYPLKKYYNLVVKVAKKKNCQVITVIHDLGSHRRKKLSIAQEINSLNRNSVVISHNQFMSKWLEEHGLHTKIVNLQIFDYLSDVEKNEHADAETKYGLVFAGALSKGKNKFIYDLDALHPKKFSLNLYGGFNKTDVTAENSIIDYKGSFLADELVAKLEGSFGLVWAGTSIEKCTGSLGEYLKFNNPHKTSLYLRAGLPIVIWDKAAMAKFIVDHCVGIAISSLANLDDELQKLSKEQYQEMKKNAEYLSKNLNDGYFLKSAIKQALENRQAS